MNEDDGDVSLLPKGEGPLEVVGRLHANGFGAVDVADAAVAVRALSADVGRSRQPVRLVGADGTCGQCGRVSRWCDAGRRGTALAVGSRLRRPRAGGGTGLRGLLDDGRRFVTVRPDDVRHCRGRRQRRGKRRAVAKAAVAPSVERPPTTAVGFRRCRDHRHRSSFDRRTAAVDVRRRRRRRRRLASRLFFAEASHFELLKNSPTTRSSSTAAAAAASAGRR